MKPNYGPSVLLIIGAAAYAALFAFTAPAPRGIIALVLVASFIVIAYGLAAIACMAVEDQQSRKAPVTDPEESRRYSA